MSNDIHSLLRLRRSGRIYDVARPVAQADLDLILEAARWAPSGGNGQPWRFLVGQKGNQTYDAILGLLMPFNVSWAQQAPVLILTATTVFRVNAKGERISVGSAQQDAGMANMSMAVEATARGMITRFMGGFEREPARLLINSEDTGIEPVTVMSLGYEGDPAAAAEDVREKDAAPRARKPLAELLLG